MICRLADVDAEGSASNGNSARTIMSSRPLPRAGGSPSMGHEDPLRTAASILSPVSLLTFFQYSNARTNTGSDTPLRK
jgi:hypothetical protein